MRKTNLLLLCIFIASSLWSKTIDLETAFAVAKASVSKDSSTINSASPVTLKRVKVSSSTTNYPHYYVFNVGNNNGFVIVSADDVATPILGYATSGNFDATNLPTNFSAWLTDVNNVISTAIDNQTAPSQEVLDKWNAYLDGRISTLKNIAAIAPLITTRWSQGSPYNGLCPLYNSTNRSVTGCVATAMAQLMKYYNYPQAGTGRTTIYTTTTNHLSIPSVTFGTFDWINMTNTYSGSSTTTEKTAVATLMYHCGVSVKMDYGSDSGASLRIGVSSLCNYFDYDKNARLMRHLYYKDRDWDSILVSELMQARPVLYSGNTTAGDGHAFICDGVDNTGLFHFNWGWGGYCDGYFATSALIPTGLASEEFSQNQTIYTNIKPDAGGASSPNIKLKTATNLSCTTTLVGGGKVFSCSASFFNDGFADFAGYYGIALVNSNNEIVSIIGKTYKTLPSGYVNTSPISIACEASKTITPGNYTLKIVAQNSGSSTWTLVTGQIGYTDTLPLEVLEYVPNTVVYPNPASDVLHIKSKDNASIRSVTITDFSGNSISTTSFDTNKGQVSLSVSNLRKGIYILTIETADETTTQKLVKR